MNKIFKPIVAFLVSLLLVAGSAQAQPGRGDNPAPQSPLQELTDPGFPPRPDVFGSMDFSSNQVCYIPEMKAFVVIDSIDCAVDLLVRQADGL